MVPMGVAITLAKVTKITLEKRMHLLQIMTKTKRLYKKHDDTMCNYCSMIGYLARTCRATKHFVDLYYVALRNKGKLVKIHSTKNALEIDVEVNALIEENTPSILVKAKTKTLEVSDFLENQDENQGGKQQSPDWWKTTQT